MIDVQRVDYIRVPVTDMEKANHFYGEVLGLERNPNSPAEEGLQLVRQVAHCRKPPSEADVTRMPGSCRRQRGP